MAEQPPLLGVVVIARNEEAHIASCIRALRRVTEFVPESEIVLVDSRSDDRTAEVAAAEGARVVRLSGRPRCCPALGRHVGTRLTRGRYVLFVDGDSEIAPGFVREAIALLDREPSVVAVGGKEEQVYYEEGSKIGQKDDYFGVGDTPREVLQLGGNGLYRRAALEAVGSFNPFVRSWEEADLGARLRDAGGRILRLPIPMARHHTPVPDSAYEYVRRLRGHLLTGQGQVLRSTFGHRTFWGHFRMLNRVVLFAAWVTIGCGAVLGSIAAGSSTVIAAWCVASALLLVTFVVRSRSLRKPFRLVLDWVVCAPPLVLGVLMGAPDPSTLRLDEAIESDSSARVGQAADPHAPRPADSRE